MNCSRIVLIFFCLLLNSFYLLSNNNLDTNVSNPVSSGSKEIYQQYTPQQNINYIQDSRLNFNFLYWLKKGILGSDAEWQIYKQEMSETPSNNLIESFARMPANIFEPLPTDIVQHQLNKYYALSVPTVYAYLGEIGLNLNIRDIGLFFGLVEDVSPEITYILDYTCDVEIVIYSISGEAVATIFAGTQRAGKYKIVWNEKDNLGKKMPSGDYIAEVRVGSEKFVRKRIVVGGY